MIFNIDKNWTRLVALRARLTRRPQVTRDRPPVVVVAKRRRGTPAV